MRIAIVCSEKDSASSNMHSIFLNEFPFKESKKVFASNKAFEPKVNENFFELFLLDELHIFSGKPNAIGADLVVFASKHSGSKPCLTTHAVGNYFKAEFGGKEKTLVKTNAKIIKAYLQNLNNLQKARPELKGYEVVLESSHHGPSLEKQCLFIEVGCEEKNWNDPNACRAVCETIINAATEAGSKAAICFGGLHYPHYFTKIALETEIAVSHICPKHFVDFVDENIFSQMLAGDSSSIDFALLEWKSLSQPQREKIISFCEASGLGWKKVKEVL
ncbi:D-aminoacyl-tRNA deacylase [archaeon]|nr:D-aminoacyl-tRNA deacylase [archaeon]